MSRVGKYPVELPAGVQVAIASGILTAKGRLGELKLPLTDLDRGEGRRQQGLGRAEQRRYEVAHDVGHDAGADRQHGEGRFHRLYVKSLEITGTGYRAAVAGTNLEMNLGFSHPVVYPIPTGIKISCERPTAIKVEGVDKRLVGQVASEIRSFRPPEPYKGKGARYTDETIRRKEGKKK